MKIKIFMHQESIGRKAFEETVEAVKALRISCEVSFQADFSKLRDQIKENCFEYDVIILDPLDRDCLEAARMIRKQNFLSSILFISVKQQKPNILRYRPSAIITEVENGVQIKDAIGWAYREYCRAHPFFTVRNKDAIIRVRYADILWFESRQRIVTLHARHQDISFYAKLADVNNVIPQHEFIRCHQSYIVNVNNVRKIDKVNKRLYLSTSDSIEISKWNLLPQRHIPQIFPNRSSKQLQILRIMKL